MSFPSAAETQAYVENTAAPAIGEVADELRELGLDVTLTRESHPEYPIDFVDLLVKFPGQDDFKYQAYPVPGQVPNFAVNLNVDHDVYFTLEIFSATGSRGHNILGYSKEQVIADVLDAYDTHVEYMSLTGDRGTPTADVHGTAPALWTDDDNDSEKTGSEHT